MDSAREYRLLPGKLPEAQKQLTNRYLVPQLSILGASVLVSTFLGMRKASPGTMIAFVIFAALFITYIGFISPRRMRKNLIKCWDSYTLTIGPDYLLRKQADTPEIRLPFQAIKRIEHLPGRYLRVVGKDTGNVIGIPEGIEDFEGVLNTVSGIVPVTLAKRDRSLKSSLLMAFGFTAYLFMLWSHSRLLVLFFAILVSSLLIWLFVFMQTSPNVLRRNKRISWMYLAFIAVSVLKVLEVFGQH